MDLLTNKLTRGLCASGLCLALLGGLSSCVKDREPANPQPTQPVTPTEPTEPETPETPAEPETPQEPETPTDPKRAYTIEDSGLLIHFTPKTREGESPKAVELEVMLQGENLWIDKNLNGTKDEDETLPGNQGTQALPMTLDSVDGAGLIAIHGEVKIFALDGIYHGDDDISSESSEIDLSKAPTLQTFTWRGQGLKEIKLPAESSLRELDLNNNQLETISLPATGELIKLNLGFNKLSGSLNLESHVKLGSLILTNNKLSELILPKGTNPQLNLLYIAGNELEALEDLSAYTELKRLALDSNRLKSLPVLPTQNNLEWLRCSKNQIERINLESVPLKELNCSNNPLKELRTSHTLQKLNCSYTQLTQLEPIVPAPAQSEEEAQYRRYFVQEITAQGCEQLSKLSLGILNSLSRVDLRDCPALTLEALEEGLPQALNARLTLSNVDAFTGASARLQPKGWTVVLQ